MEQEMPYKLRIYYVYIDKHNLLYRQLIIQSMCYKK